MSANWAGVGGEVPAGDLKGSAKDLGTYEFGHDDLVAEAAGEKEGYNRGGKERVHRQNNNLIVVAAGDDHPVCLACRA